MNNNGDFMNELFGFLIIICYYKYINVRRLDKSMHFFKVYLFLKVCLSSQIYALKENVHSVLGLSSD